MEGIFESLSEMIWDIIEKFWGFLWQFVGWAVDKLWAFVVAVLDSWGVWDVWDSIKTLYAPVAPYVRMAYGILDHLLYLPVVICAFLVYFEAWAGAVVFRAWWWVYHKFWGASG